MNKAAYIILAITAVSYIVLALLRPTPPPDKADQKSLNQSQTKEKP